MAKRFTDNEKWKKNFFRALPSKYKLFWLYLCDDCSNAGLWDTSEMEVAELRIGEKIDLNEALNLFNSDEKRIIEFNCGKKWFIPSFVLFQYGDDFAVKAGKNRLIESVIALLTKFDLLKSIPVGYPLDTRYNGYQRMEKDREKEKDKEKEILETPKPLKHAFDLTPPMPRTPPPPDLARPKSVEEVAEYMTSRGMDRGLAQKWWDYYDARGWMMGKSPMKRWRSAVNTWKHNQAGANDRPKLFKQVL